MHPLLFQTPFPPEQCKTLLENSAEKDIPFLADWTFKPGILARVHDNSFRLRIRRGMWHNSFDRLFYGQLESTGSGALIHGTFRLHPFVVAFTTVWFCGVAFIGGLTVFLIVAGLIRHRSHVDGALAGVAIPMLMLAFGIALLRFGRHLSRSGEARLQRFICETLSAREVSSAGGAVSSR